MHIVIATAEPFGGYHLEPLDSLMESDNMNTYTFLIPYNSPIQGNGLSGANISHSLESLYTADRLIVTGGNYSSWTNSLAHNAKSLGIEVFHAELAYIGDDAPRKYLTPAPDRSAVMSVSSAEVIRKHFELDDTKISIMGSPQLDFVAPLASKNIATIPSLDSSNMLIVSSVSLPESSIALLVSAAEKLLEIGANVEVRTHPREDAEIWTSRGFTLSDRSKPVIEILSQTDYALAAAGSFNPMLYFAGIPTVSILAVNHENAPSAYTKLTGVSEDGQNILEESLWETAANKITNEQALAKYLFGEIGGSSKRVLDFWRS